MTRTTFGLLIVLALAVVAAVVWLAGSADASGCMRTPGATVCQTDDIRCTAQVIGVECWEARLR